MIAESRAAITVNVPTAELFRPIMLYELAAGVAHDVPALEPRK